MIHYIRKEDQYCKYYIKYDDTNREALAIYKNKSTFRWGINAFLCFPKIYEGSEYVIITQNEYSSKLEVAKSWIK